MLSTTRGAANASPAARSSTAPSWGGERLAPGPAPRGSLPPPPPRGDAGRCCAGRGGYFSEADPKAEVLPVKGGLAGDITQRPKSRWESDFIWNKDWAKQLDYEEGLRRQQAEGAAAAAAPLADGKGRLSLSSKVDLNSMDVDLSAQLRPRKKAAARAAPAGAPAAPRKRAPPRYAAVPPTRVEQRAWQRSGKFTSRVVNVPVGPLNDAEKEELATTLAEEQVRFDQLKAELQGWNAGLTAACLAATFVFYGRDTAASYAVGALGGLVYLRMLTRTVEGVTSGGGAAGQPRLLIPLLLVLGLNRYSALGWEARTGVELQLLPMLVGFFTYKGAVVARQSLELFADLAAGAGGRSGEDGGAGEGGKGGERGGAGAAGAASVDRVFRKRVLTEM